MITKKIRSLEKRIQTVKNNLAALGPLRPGSLSKQYKDSVNKRGAFYQLSYTHKMKSRTEYVRAEHIALVKKELAEYKRYRALTEQYLELSIAVSKEKINELKKRKSE